MGKLFIAFLGIVLFFYGLTLGNNLQQGEKLALSLDDKKKAFAAIGEDSLPSCLWDVKTPDRVMAENKSQAIVIQTKNSAKKPCESYLSLRSTGFEKNPPKEEQKVTLPVGGKGSISWILTPHKAGTFDIAVSDIINTKIFGITVTNIFGLTGTQAQYLSVISTLCGPMLTVPWWWDRWRQKKQKQEVKKEEEKKE